MGYDAKNFTTPGNDFIDWAERLFGSDDHGNNYTTEGATEGRYV